MPSVKGFSPVAEAMLRLALDPKVAPVRNNPGDVVNAQGKLEDCSPVTAAMELDPNHADAFDNHGNIWSWTLNGDDSPPCVRPRACSVRLPLAVGRRFRANERKTGGTA